MDPRIVKINEALKCSQHIPRNKWDYGKMHENNVSEASKRVEKYKIEISEFENKCRLRGMDETEIQQAVYRQFSQMYIQYLEQLISAKKSLAMMNTDTVEELTRQKIIILEELASI
jgi:hypothetical protein